MGFGFRMAFETEKGQEITMRPFHEDDIPQMLVGMQSYEVCRTLSTREAQTEKLERDWLSRVEADDSSVLWAICIDDVVIGSSDLHRRSDNRWSSGSVIFDRQCWGQGIAKAAHRARTWYAVEVLNLLSIESGFLKGNLGSQRALYHSGYFDYGTVYRYDYAQGEPKDMGLMLWVDPRKYSWQYFWNGKPPKDIREAAKAGRERALAALKWAEENVRFL